MTHRTNFKPPKGTAKAERRKRSRDARGAEGRGKKAVRLRDRRCRFPLCGCHRLGLALHVSHLDHKGMGGNPKGDRSTPDRMVRVCIQRHRESRVSIDRGSIWWEGLTPKGANGPIKWMIDAAALWKDFQPEPYQDGAIELARETAPFQYEPLTPWQRAVLLELGKMYC